MKSSKVQKMIMVAMFSAMGYVLMLFDFPILPSAVFLKVDFSDIPVLLGMFIYGPAVGIATAFVRNSVHFLTSSPSLPGLVGDFASFMASVLFTLPIYYFFKKDPSKGNMAVGLLTGIASLTIFMSVANYFVLTPMYMFLANSDFGTTVGKMVLFGVIPFNILKGILVSGVFLVVYVKLLPWLTKKQARYLEKHSAHNK